MEIEYGSNKIGDNGIYISPLRAFKPPKVTFTDIKSDRYYTLLMFDPDAVGGNKIHWLIVNYKKKESGNCIFSYVGPNPPKGTGTHHYYFLLIKQKRSVNVIALQDRQMSILELFKILGLDDSTIKDRKCFTSS